MSVIDKFFLKNAKMPTTTQSTNAGSNINNDIDLNPFQPSSTKTDFTSSAPTTSPPASFWQLTSNPQLLGNVFDSRRTSFSSDSVDLVCIGGGISGVSAAYHAVHKLPIGTDRRSVMVLEARSFCEFFQVVYEIHDREFHRSHSDLMKFRGTSRRKDVNECCGWQSEIRKVALHSFTQS